MCMVLTISSVYIKFFSYEITFPEKWYKKSNSRILMYFGQNYIHALLSSYGTTACLVFEVKVMITILGTPHSHVKDS